MNEGKNMCKRLFIFGNGFDIMHQKENQLNTKYSNFRSWLISKCNNFDDDRIYDFSLPIYQTNYRRLESYDEAEFAEFFVRLIDDADNTICEDDEWKHFEDTLGILNWNLILNNVFEQYDEDGDLDPWKMQNNYASLSQNAGETSHILSKFFKEWIVDVNSDFSKITNNPFFNQINMTNNDLFLNFNYTSTLEKVYGITDVCHIHGDASKYQDLIIGHGKAKFDNEETNYLKDEAFDFFENIFNSYKKKPIENINRHIDFFKKINSVEEIFVLGVSFGDADVYYFKYIFSVTNAKNLYLYVYNDTDYEKTKDKVKKLGFKGNIINWKHFK